MRFWVVWTAAILAMVGVAKAEPLNLKQVPAEAKWVAHVDVDAMRESTVIQKAYYKIADLCPDGERLVDKIREFVAMDPRNDLHGITLGGTVVGQPEVALLVHAEVDQKALLDKVSKAPDYKEETYGAYKLHCWTDAKGKKHEHPMAGTFAKPNMILLAPTVDILKAVLDTMDGKSPSLAGSKSPLAASVPDGALVLARAVGLADAKLPMKSPLVTKSDTFSLAIGESGGQSFAEAALLMKSPEDAQRVKALLDGGRAMLELQHGDDAEAMKMLNKVKVTLAGPTLKVEFRASADDVGNHAEKAARRILEHHKKFLEKKLGAHR